MMTVEIETRVKIKPHANYKGKYTNEEGTVLRSYKDMVGVKLDKFTNKSSTYGVFWFNPSEIEFIEREDNIMCNDYAVAEIQFLEGSNSDKKYPYALYDPGVAVGDLVVVKTGHHGLAVAKVASISECSSQKVQCGREIICVVDMTAYNERKEKAKAIADLKSRMDMKVQQLQQTALYELLAEKDPELACMLQELKGLLG